MKKELVLITGGAGFIGSHTADLLASQGYRVRILDNLNPAIHPSGNWPSYVKNKGYELIRGDVREKAAWQRALRGVSYVIHLAAHQDQRLDFSTFFEVNTVSTALLYETVIGYKLPVKKIILASSQFVYGDGAYQCPATKKIFYPEPRSLAALKKGEWEIKCHWHRHPARFLPFREDQQVDPTNSYGLSKQALENLALRLGKTYNIPTTVLRYSIVQGARQSPHNIYSGALRIFVVQALTGEPITVYEDGKQKRDFVYVGDAVNANLLALKDRRTNFKVFNVGGGKTYSVGEFARLVKKITHSPSKIILGSFRRTDTRHAVSDISKLKKLGWRPTGSPADSIREYASWIKRAGLANSLKKGIDKKLKKEKIVY